ncbi:MAG: hypothetical protein QOH93_2225, partial [Chloroflexia bacterium]|nr:hypothetical protein [Chloroflexia bacterium]
MTEWLVKLRGNTDHLAKLAEEFDSALWQIIDEHGSYYLKASSLDNLTDPKAVRLEASELLAGLEGALLFRVKRVVEVSVAYTILRINEDGSRDTFRESVGLDISIRFPQTEL